MSGGLFSSDLLGLGILIVIGLIVIFAVHLLFVLVPAVLAAFVVWFFTGDLLWTGVAFLLVTVLSILGRL